MLHSFKLKFKLLQLLFLTTIYSLILLLVSCWASHHILLFLLRFLHWTATSSCCRRSGCRDRWLFFLYYFRNFCFGRRLFFRDDLSTSIVCLRYNIFLCETKGRIDSSSSFFSKVVVSPISAVKVIISFEPLSKLQVVLVFSFG